MKWKNKGHEYDLMYSNIEKKNKYYLFGAGDYGHQFLAMFKDEINIVGFIDNSVNKIGNMIEGIKCYAFNDIKLKDDETIILTMSQIARVKPVEQLLKSGKVHNIDYFLIEEFISV